MNDIYREHSKQATDAEMAAAWAIDALKAGRYSLGHALSRIADQAAKAAATPLPAALVNVQHRGATRDEQPARPAVDTSTPHLLAYVESVSARAEQVRTDGAAASARIPDLVGAAVTELFPAAQPADGLPAAGRCVAMATIDGVHGECRVPIYWKPGRVGDAATPAVRAGWRHVDPALDQDHEAKVPNA